MNLKLIIQGFIVGIGKIIPGVSGAMMAMLMGIYEDLMEAITRFFDDKVKHFKLLLNFGIGVLIAIVLFSRIILFLLNNYYYETIYMFLGLIVGTIFKFKRNINFNKKNIILFLIIIILMFIIPYLKIMDMYVFKNTILDYLYIMFLGSIDALTSIIPGISGTAIFMMMGAYEFVLSILGNPFSIYFLIYAFGLVNGIIITCILMYYLLKYRKEETNVIIFAFSLASILLLFLGVSNNINIFVIIIFIVGMILGYLFD